MKSNDIEKEPLLPTDAAVLSWLENKAEQLHAHARMLVDDYWRQLNQRHQHVTTKERGRIGLRIRRRESRLSFSIEWYRIATLRQNGQNKPICQYLKKGPGYRYPLQRILKGEPDWEQQLVETLENEFADIRKQMAMLGKLRDAYLQFQKAMETGLR
ncbi:conjugative transfer protein MobI(A/C) [Methylomonas montana]|uniref:conjugative transfer protein MobI(A/C) n=1 Tax=Methylomonas montana TaxID=3058963 RepID=UPI00265AC734|nr:conjugative transfer protein MobI(A/C) [Methylomonas montana]WKJ90242.1 conjugative transfer protein MobI(A/C) [Methylomonas montana]